MRRWVGYYLFNSYMDGFVVDFLSKKTNRKKQSLMLLLYLLELQGILLGASNFPGENYVSSIFQRVTHDWT